jgi:murein DD-endopeptidase MepM/ murein hydrolase activator NlpD
MLKALLFPALLMLLPPAEPPHLTPPTKIADAAPLAPFDYESACTGAFVQGGLIICRGVEGTRFELGDTVLIADASESVAFGLGRKAAPSVSIDITPVVGQTQTATFEIARRHDETATLRGIDCDKIDARTEEQKAHASRSWLKKQEGWQNFNEGRGGLDGFLRPAEGPVSSPFGYVRKYVTEGCPTKERPHFGYDIAAPTGAPIIAPAAGIVTLAEPNLYYEGGTVFLDHGQGLVSLFLHMSELDVAVGDVLQAGDAIGKIGATGRVTGAHLHWAVKWRNTSRSDRDGDFYIDPALLLALSPSAAQ